MKKFLTLTIIALVALIALSTNVNAAETAVSTWADLKTALEGTEYDTVTLENSVTVSTEETLDLNGKTLILKQKLVVDGDELTITGNGKITSSEAGDLIVVKQGSSLIVENGILENTAYDNGVVRIEGNPTDTDEKTTLTVKADAKLRGNYCVYIPAVGGFGVVINVYGTLEAITENNGYNEGSIGISVNGTLQSTTGNVPEIYIHDGAVITTEEGKTDDVNDDDAPAIYAAGYAIWNISGGSITGSEALSIKAGKFNITGGTFAGNGKYVNPATPEGSGSEATGSAISITANSGYSKNVEMKISNAEVTSENGFAISESTTLGVGTAVNSIEVTSGDFSGKEGAVFVANTDEIGKFVKGGTFSSSVAEFIDANSGLTNKEEDGINYVGMLHTITGVDTEYGKVTPDKTEAVKGQTIKLTVEPKDGYRLKNLVVVDGPESFSIDVTDSKTFVMPDVNVTVIAIFEAIPEAPENPGSDEPTAPVEPGNPDSAEPENSDPEEPTTPIEPGNSGAMGETEQEPTDDKEVEQEPSDDKESDKETNISEDLKEEGKDDTPTTGSVDMVVYISAIIAAVALTGIVIVKKYTK